MYASLYIVEGVGLILRKRWAEWLTASATTIFIPMEIFELFRGLTITPSSCWRRGINVAIVIYLFARLRREAIAQAA